MPFAGLGHGVQWGLERTRTLLAALGEPQTRYETIHIGGTNGKGSVAAMCASVLAQAGHKTGLYTSPHLRRFGERIQIAGRPVSDDVVTRVENRLASVVDEIRPTFFEAATALAFGAFADREVEIAVVEVGLGGRLDATNVLTPRVTCITNISLDHAEYLGGTVEEIAREKAGIIKPRVPVHTGETDASARRILQRAAERRDAPFFALDPERDIDNVKVSGSGTRFRLAGPAGREIKLEVPLAGIHQAANAALAVSTLESLPRAFRPDRNAVVRGLAGVHWPGRVQLEVRDGVTWVFDVAHNAAGMGSLAHTLGLLRVPKPLVVLAGILGDKDWGRMLPGLLSGAACAVLTQPPSAPAQRRWDPAEVGALLVPHFAVETETDFGRALSRAAERAQEGTVVVTGSCHTVGCALALLDIEPFPDPPSV